MEKRKSLRERDFVMNAEDINRQFAAMLEIYSWALKDTDKGGYDGYGGHMEVGVGTEQGRRVLQVIVECRVLNDWPEWKHETPD